MEIPFWYYPLEIGTNGCFKNKIVAVKSKLNIHF